MYFGDFLGNVNLRWSKIRQNLRLNALTSKSYMYLFINEEASC